MRNFALLTPFDPREGTVIRQAPGNGPGYWCGAPGAAFVESTGEFYLAYRLRRPRGAQPDRGAELRIARSYDGVEFEDIWSATKDRLGTTSIERCALACPTDRSWRLYVSYVDPADGRWMIGLVEASSPERFDLAACRPVLKAGNIAGGSVEGVKDPFVFRVAGLYHMLVSFARCDRPASADELHGTHDAFNTGLIRSATALATSSDGITWQWEGEVFAPQASGWDAYAARIGTLWYQAPVWLALYDGSAGVGENYEERCGIAYSFDLRRFYRVTTTGPLFPQFPPGKAIRYFDAVETRKATYFYYEMARDDGSHDLCVYRTG